jgi:S1-C subfamily serine protease
MVRLLGVVSCTLLLSLLFAKSGAGQQITSQLRNGSTGGQAGTIDSSTTIGSQDADKRALEISRQPDGQPPTHNEIEAPRTFKPSEDEASFDRDLKTESEQHTVGRAPYLGIRIAETSECFEGNEEHGLEVLSVRPGSPAAKAGLNATAGFSAPASIAAAIFIPVGLAAHALLHRAGMPGYSHDLIIGVNDHRVHDKTELDRELSKLKPGDSSYINVVHPLPSGSHQTLRVFITVGEWRTEAPLESSGRSLGPATFDSSGNVSYAY